MTSRTEALAARIDERFKEKLARMPSTCGELTYEVAPYDLIAVCAALRDEAPFKLEMLMDLCGVDYLQYGEVEWTTESATETGYSRGVNRYDPVEAAGVMYDPEHQGKPRFAVAYHLLSITHNHRVRVRAFCPDDDVPMIDSVTDVWASANWYEREAFDLFGILFNGHPDLRRLLTDYGFIGHPFRKDFPLIGNVEVRYDPEEGRVVYQPVSIEPRTLVPKVIRHDHRYEPALKE